MKKFDSVNSKLMILGVMPILLVSIMLGTYFTSTRIQDVQANLIQKGNLIAHNLAPSVEFGLFSHDKKFLSSLIVPLLSDVDVLSIVILDESRKPVVTRFSSTYNEVDKREDSLSTFEAPVYLSGFESEDSLFGHHDNPSLFETETEVSSGDVVSFNLTNIQEPALMGWVVVTLSHSSSNDRQTEIILNVILFIFLGLLMSGVIAYRIALQIACPIKALTDTVLDISNGNLSARVKLNGVGEMRDLQRGVNAMAEIVQYSQQQLEEEILQATEQLTDTIAELEEKNVSLTTTQSKLLKANAAKGEFLAKMSHEIRTPLTAVMGFSRLIETAETKEDIASYTRIVNRSGVQLLNIIDDILDFSKLESDTQRLWNEQLNLRDAMDDVLCMLSPAAKAKKIALVSKVSNEIPVTLLGDTVKLTQIMINLVNNAIKFTDTGSVLINAQLIDSSEDEILLEFEVVDTGIGVSTETAEKIFSSFAQAESDNKRSFEGVGLGLAIAKKLVELMGGQIGVDTTVSLGARFWFVVPLKLTDNVNRQILLPIKKTIILFDTCDVSRQALSNMMLSWKIDLYVCETELEVINLLQDDNLSIDVLLISLEFNSEYYSYHLLKQVREYFNGCVIFLCNDSAEKIREMVESDSVICVLEKPVQNQRLYFTLKNNKIDGTDHTYDAFLEEGIVEKTTVKFPSLADQSSKEIVSTAQSNIELDVKSVASSLLRQEPKSKLKPELKQQLNQGSKSKSEPKIKYKILVAEDNEYNAMLIYELLKERAISCDCVENANAVLEAIKHKKYDALLLDVHMPIKDGLTLASEIRNKQYIEPNIPIILFTADVYVLNNRELNAKGVNDVLYKPLSDKALDTLLLRWLPEYKCAELQFDQGIYENSKLLDDVLIHLLGIEQSFFDKDNDALTMFFHQLEGTLGYFQLDHLLKSLKELEVYAYANDIDEFKRTLSHLRVLVQILTPKSDALDKDKMSVTKSKQTFH